MDERNDHEKMLFGEFEYIRIGSSSDTQTKPLESRSLLD